MHWILSLGPFDKLVVEKYVTAPGIIIVKFLPHSAALFSEIFSKNVSNISSVVVNLIRLYEIIATFIILLVY